MMQGWHLKDQKEWAKVRLNAYIGSLGPFLKKPIRSLDKIIKLPLIDGQADDRVDENIKYLLGKKKEAEERRKAKQTPTE